MNTHANLWSGRVMGSVHDFVANYPDFVNAQPFVLITSIDSSMDVIALPTITSVVSTEHIQAEPVETALLISGVELIKLVHLFEHLNGFPLFNGFDELWFFEERPEHNRPVELSIVGPYEANHQIDHRTMQRFAAWLKRANCSGGIGDGIGLNYVSEDQSLVKVITESFFPVD